MTRLPSLGRRGEGWLVGQLVLIAAIGTLGLPGLGSLPPLTGVRWAALILGLGLLAAGIALGGLGVRELGPGLTALPRPRPTAGLVESGVYRHIRHPIYAGVMLAGVGWAVATASLPALVASLALIAWFDLKARREEAWLLERFTAYADYRARTRRFLPAVY